jgi:hypothetical protein
MVGPRLAVALALAAALLSGCGEGDFFDEPLRRVTCEDFRDLRRGMTLDEANGVVGERGRVDLEREGRVRYVWSNPDGSFIWAWFEGGRLDEKGESGVCDDL